MTTDNEAQHPAGRPTLVIGSTERAIEDIRAGATSDTTALLKAEIERCRGTVRQAFDGMKDALAGFERTCDQALGAGSAEASAALAGVVERMVAAATAASVAAAHRARAEARVEVDELQAVVAKLHETQELDREQLKSLTDEFEQVSQKLAAATGDLASVTARLETASSDLAAERSGRAETEAALKDAEGRLHKADEERRGLTAAHDTRVRALQSELESLRGELARLQKQAEAERAERARLVAAIQQVVAPGEIAAAITTPPAPPPPAAPPAPAVASAPPAPSPSAAPQEMPPPPTSDPELVIYVEHLLKTVEAMYAEDVAARRKPDDILNRLTDNLRSARNVFRNHVGASDPEELTLFDYQLTTILNTTEDTAFGRHLGIAAYECQKARRS
jgi:hypothetical protein